MSVSPQPKRARHTYTRKRMVDDTDRLPKAVEDTSPSANDFGDIAPSIPLMFGKPNLSRGFVFGGTRRALEEVDELYRDDEHPIDSRQGVPLNTSQSQETLLEGDTTLVMDENISPLEKPAPSHSLSFGRPTLLDSWGSPSRSSPFGPRRRKSHRASVLDSDDDLTSASGVPTTPKPPVVLRLPPVSDDEDNLSSHGHNPLHPSPPKKPRTMSSTPEDEDARIGQSTSEEAASPVGKQVSKDKRRRSRRSQEQSGSKRRVTKKDLELTRKEQARIQASRTAQGPARTTNTSKYSLDNLLISFRPPSGPPDASDPIEPFSSSPNAVTPITSQGSLITMQTTSQDSNPDEAIAAVSDAELQSPTAIHTIRKENEKKLELQNLKLRMLADAPARQRKARDEDDLVVSRESSILQAAPSRPPARSLPWTSPRKQQKFNPVNVSEKRAPSHGGVSFPAEDSLKHVDRPDDLNRALMHHVKKANVDAIKKKEAEWESHGGRIHRENLVTPGLAETLARIASKPTAQSLHRDDEGGLGDGLDASEDQDEEYFTASGSSHAGSDDEDPDSTLVDDGTVSMAEEQDITPSIPLRSRHRRVQNVVQSDSEDETNRHPLPSGGDIPSRVGLEARALSSEASGDEDKENHLFDDKENLEIRPPFKTSQSATNLAEGLRRTLSVNEETTDGENDENAPLPKTTGLRPIGSQRSLSQGKSPSFLMRLQMAAKSQGANEDPEKSQSTSFSPVVPKDASFTLSFSHFDEGNQGLQAGFGEFFSETQQTTRSDGDVSLNPRPEPGANQRRMDGLAKLRKSEGDLGLTQDVALQPALDVEHNVLRKADAAFEKEQGYVLEEAFQQNRTEEVLYVNDHGFLTQTRPEGDDPEIYRAPISPSQHRSRTPLVPIPLSQQGSQRKPLGKLYERQDDSDDEVYNRTPSRKRLRRRRISSEPSEDQSDDFVLPSPKRFKDRRPLADKSYRMERGRNDYVAEEADESDEDELMGFGCRKDDEEEDGAHLDQNLSSLVDDRLMGEGKLKQNLVLEKFREHEEADDVKLQQRAQAVVDGEMRRKKRGGVGIDDSDEEDDEEDANARARRKLKRVTLSADVQSLYNNEATRSFIQPWFDITNVDPEDRVTRSVSPDTNAIPHRSSEPTQSDDETGDDQYSSERDEDAQTISQSQIVQQVRALRQREAASEPFDVNNVDFVDEEQEDMYSHPRIREVARKRKTAPTDRDTLGAPPFRLNDDFQTEPMRKWAKGQLKTLKGQGTGRSVGRAAVTGHNSRKQSVSGPVRNQSRLSEAEQRSSKRRRTGMLKDLGDRSGKFEDR